MTTVLVALHYQNEVMHAAGKIKVGVAEDAADRDALVSNAARLLALARRTGIPVVSVRIAFRPDHADVVQNCAIFRNVVAGKAMIDGSWGAEFHEGLGPRDGEFVVKHSRVNAFYGSQLEEVLRILKADRLIVAGVATNSVVLTTVACAADMGYEVTVIADACSSGNPALHASSLENMKLVADVVDLAAFEASLAAA
ncbi:MAG: cysteine hydrolase [Rhizobiaceae bacterium]|nr:cysteine hydrolase [Rhizobiaceae bacterium]